MRRFRQVSDQPTQGQGLGATSSRMFAMEVWTIEVASKRPTAMSANHNQELAWTEVSKSVPWDIVLWKQRILNHIDETCLQVTISVTAERQPLP